jgi:hypothetical protein
VDVFLDGSVADWVGRTGKLLLFIAGLAGLIDVIGPDRFNRWSDNSATHRDLLRKQLRVLRAGRGLLHDVHKLVDLTISAYSTDRVGVSPSDWYSATEAREFAHRTRETLKRKRLLSESQGRFFSDPIVSSHPSAREIVYHDAIEFLSDRLTSEQKEVLNPEAFTYKARRQYVDRFEGFVLVCIFLGIIAVRFIPHPESWNESYSMLVLAITVVFLSSAWRDVCGLTLLRLATEIRFRLFRMALTLIGPKKDGWRLRFVALVAFVAGSLLDLVVSW